MKLVNMLNLRYTILSIMLSMVFGLSAQMSSHIMQSRPFTDIYVKGNINVECRHSADSAGMIVFSATPAVFDAVNCNNAGHRLNIIVEGVASNLLRRNLSTIVVYCDRKLSLVSYTGSGVMKVENTAFAPEVAVSLTGSGRLRVENIVATHLNCSVTGSGVLSVAGNTRVGNLTCSVSGSGTMEFVHVDTETASATVNGKGCLVLNGKTDNASFALKGSGSIDASSLDCRQLKAGSYGSGQIFHSRRVANVITSGNTNNIISR